MLTALLVLASCITTPALPLPHLPATPCSILERKGKEVGQTPLAFALAVAQMGGQAGERWTVALAPVTTTPRLAHLQVTLLVQCIIGGR